MVTADIFPVTIDFLLFVLPILIPIFLIWILAQLWVNYVRTRFISEQENAIYQIFPPQDVFKSPVAMELFLEALYQTGGEGDPIAKYWKGSMRPWFSLEIASIGGKVGFYIWTRKNMGGYLQSQIYAQYPGIEVVEVEDYAVKVNPFDGEHSIWGMEFKLTEDDPIPIKTYVDYGLDKVSVDETEKIDPITPTLEFLGSLTPGHNAWLQIIVRAHKKEDKDPEKMFKKTDLWKDRAKSLIVEIRDQSLVEVEVGDYKTKVNSSTRGQTDKINAIERSQGKLPFDCGIRAVYVAEKDIFDKSNIGGLVGSFRQYSSANLNGFKKAVATGTEWWKPDPFGRLENKQKKEIFDAYVAREYFNRPYLGKTRIKFILNSEELATIFHFPGRVAATPGLDRVQSRKQEAPSDLPV